jgi:trk system potassium uptake protein TrkH
MRKKQLRKRNPALILVVGFGGLIIVGAMLLALPVAAADGRSIGFLDSFFTSTSAVCITGLSVFDLGTTLSPFGQIVLLALVQLGGIGFMTMTSLVFMVMGRRITLSDRVAISDSLGDNKLQGVVRMTRNVVIITATAEGIGVLLLSLRFVPLFGLGQGIYYSVFHAVSSFCNAGFDVFGMGTSLIPFVGDPLVNIVTMMLIIVGGIGFFVILDLLGITRRKKKHMNFHTKIVLIITGILIAFGFLLFLAAEGSNPETLGAKGMTASDKVFGALFQSVTTRTAGFASIPQDNMLPISKVASVGLMFIGASPASTGGGIKTTTFAVLVLFVASIIKGKDDVEVFRRTINRRVVLRAVATCALAITLVLVASAAIAVIEHGVIELSDIVYEATSAFGTVGLSTGVTALFSPASKILLMRLLFLGRVGVFTFTVALSARLAKKKVNIHYPEDKILIG